MSTIGGGVIRDYNFSQAWGVNPAAASGTALLDIIGGPGGTFGIGVGDYVNFSFGSAASFLGIISESSESVDFGSGRTQTFQVVDNRVRLGWQMVFAAYNVEDDVAGKVLHRPIDGESSPPVEVWKTRRRYKHLLPENWAKGLWTYTTVPMTAAQVLDSAFGGAWGDYSFSRAYHTSLQTAIYLGLDWSTGIKLSNLVSEICGKSGLEVGLTGERTLRWVRKGVGLAPLPDATSTSRRSGQSLTSNDTRVRVVGERIRLQAVNITLEPDWQPGWEAFIDELAWHREVASAFAMPAVTKSDLLEVSAFARKVTVYDYAKKKGDTDLLDPRNYGSVSRNFIPAWIYIQEIVYRSYRIPSTFTLHGIPLSSLEFADSLLAGVDVVGEGLAAKQVYASDPVQFYPSQQAAVISRGQPLDLINTRDIRLFYRNSTGDLRNEWTASAEFEVDNVGKSIRFATPWFIDGLASAGKSIYFRVNRGEGGETDITSEVEADSDLLDIVVPNPNFEITPAEVRASFCFLLGRFHQDFGSGRRFGSLVSGGLDLHVLDLTTTGGFSAPGTASVDEGLLPFSGVACREILYEDGGSAQDKAAEIAASLTLLEELQASGGFTRNGLAGTPLSAVVDRVTVSITTSGGVTEQVEYTKARPSAAAFSERTLQRLQRSDELFPGQESLKREVREYRLLAAANRPAVPPRIVRYHTSLGEIFEYPVGGSKPRVQRVSDKNSASPERTATLDTGGARWLAGDVVWLDQAGHPTKTGGTFGGVVVTSPGTSGAGGAATANKQMTVALSGRVPVRCKSGLPVNSVVSANPGEHVGSEAGSVAIGRLAHGEDLPVSPSGELFAMVDLGSGGAGDTTVVAPLTIVTAKPAYIPAPSAPVASGFARFFLTWGLVNGVLATNWNNCLDVQLSGTSRYLFIKAMVTTTATANLRVTSCEWLTGIAADTYVTPVWPTDGTRPAFVIIPLGMVSVEGGVATPLSAGGGSIEINEHIAQIAPGTSGSSVYRKRFSYKRLNY